MSDYFPRDLHLQILKRLPLNSILKCQSVCKSWNSLITSTDFISAHLLFTKSINPNGSHTLFIRYFDRTHKIEKYITIKDDETFGFNFSNIKDFQYASKAAYFRVVGYCDGVVCLSDDLFDCMDVIILWNPSIQKSLRVIVPTNYEQTWPQSTTVLGFGVCPMTHDPKVIRIVYFNDYTIPNLIRIEDPPSVDVFSLKLGSWRKPFGGDRIRPRETIQITWSQVCFNGVVYWVACENQIESNFNCLIVSFDLVREVFDEMSLPDALACQRVSNLSISNRKEYLSVLECYLEKGNESCGVWVMKDYGVLGSWEKVYVVRLPGMLRRTVGFRMNGEMVLALKNHELVFVEFMGNVKSLGIYGNIQSFFLRLYEESLILINN